MEQKMKIDHENTNVNMPMKTVISLIVLVSIFTFSYFQITERLNNLETANELMKADLLKKAEQTPKNLEIFMLLEESFKQIEKLEKNQEQNMTNKVNIEFLKEQMNKVLNDIEKLKDKQRSFANGEN